MDRCLAQLKESSSRSDIIILSGGLGPTEDDMTKEAVAQFNKLPLVEDKESRKTIEDYFAKRNIEPTENNWKQALLPKGAKAIPNANGTAPGIILETKNCTYILLPGYWRRTWRRSSIASKPPFMLVWATTSSIVVCS